MATQFVVLAIADEAEARQLMLDLHRWPSDDLLTPGGNNPVRAVWIAQGIDPPDLQRPAWAAAIQASLDRLEGTLMATQADIDAITSNLDGLGTSLDSIETELLAGIEELKKQNPNLDVSALQTAAGHVSTAKEQLQGTADALPQPTPPPV
jgi:L-rhamnose isomerase